MPLQPGDQLNPSGGSFTITCTKQKVYPTYKHSTFKLSRGKLKPRVVQHYWFTAWPDHGVPTARDGSEFFCDDVIDLLEIVNKERDKKKRAAPLVVHCSAGVGRTGTFIALDHAMRTLRVNSKTDALKIIKTIREDRVRDLSHFPTCYDLLSAIRASTLGRF